jgi:hypothetical protein
MLCLCGSKLPWRYLCGSTLQMRHLCGLTLWTLSLQVNFTNEPIHGKAEIMHQAVVERNTERTVLMVLKGQN